MKVETCWQCLHNLQIEMELEMWIYVLNGSLGRQHLFRGTHPLCIANYKSTLPNDGSSTAMEPYWSVYMVVLSGPQRDQFVACAATWSTPLCVLETSQAAPMARLYSLMTGSLSLHPGFMHQQWPSLILYQIPNSCKFTLIKHNMFVLF